MHKCSPVRPCGPRVRRTGLSRSFSGYQTSGARQQMLRIGNSSDDSAPAWSDVRHCLYPHEGRVSRTAVRRCTSFSCSPSHPAESLVTEVPEHLLQRAAEARARLALAGPRPTQASGSERPRSCLGPGRRRACGPHARRARGAQGARARGALRRGSAAPQDRCRSGSSPCWPLPAVLGDLLRRLPREPPPLPAASPSKVERPTAAQCAGCHGGAGGGGTGRQLSGGEVIATFPANDEGRRPDGLLGRQRHGGRSRRRVRRPGPSAVANARPGSFGVMGGFGGGLSAEELAAVVYHERCGLR